MIKRVSIFAVLLVVVALVLGACGDTATPATTTTVAAPATTTVAATTTTAATTTAATTTAATTTVAATTAPATTTVAATTAPATTIAASTAAATTGSSSTTAASAANDIPPYTGATVLQVPDALKTQYTSSLSNAVTNPQAGAFATADSGDKVKTFYQNYFSTNGWTDLSSIATSLNSSLTALNGFALAYFKGQTVVVMLGLPSSTASALGFTDTTIPANGTVALFFSGEAVSGSLTGGSTTTTTAATAGGAATTAAASGSGSASVVAPTGTTEITLPQDIMASFLKTLPGGLGSNANITVKLYTSNDDATTAGTNYDKQLTSSGWQFAVPGMTGPQSSGSGSVGLYSQSGTDLIFVTGDASQMTQPSSSLTSDQLNQVKQLLGSSKTVIVVVSGQGVVNAFMQSGSSSTPTPTAAS